MLYNKLLKYSATLDGNTKEMNFKIIKNLFRQI